MVHNTVSVLSSTRCRHLAFALLISVASIASLSSCVPPPSKLAGTPVGPSPDDNLVLVSADAISNTVILDDAWVIGSVDDMMHGATEASSRSSSPLAGNQSSAAFSRRSNLSSLPDSAMVLVPKDTLGANVKVLGDLYSDVGFSLPTRRMLVFTPADIRVSEKPIDGVWKVYVRPSGDAEISSSGTITHPNTIPSEITIEVREPDCPNCDWEDVCRRVPGCCGLFGCPTQ